VTFRAGTAVAAAAMTLVALVVAHNLVFLAGYGEAYADALVHTGHDYGWSAAVFTILAGGMGTVIVGLWQLRRLSAMARPGGEHASRPLSINGFIRRWLRLTMRLATATALLFVLQENGEQLHIGESLPGLTVLGSPAYPNAIAIIAAVAGVVALVGALFGWRFDQLLARIGAARLRPPRPSKSRTRVVPDVDRRPGALLGPGLAVRAPPGLIAA
jgi:hypothetical protein